MAVSLLVPTAIIIYLIRNAVAPDDPPSVTNSIGPRAKPSLQLVIVVTRHGKRGPMITYPTCPYPIDDTKAWPYGVAQLTKSGRTQMYRLGAKIRSLYNGYLNESYFDEDFKAVSTLMDRTLMSASVLLAGLYPPRGYQVWDQDLFWQPLPIYPNYLDHNQMVPPQSSITTCPRFHEAQNQSFTRFEKENGARMMDMMATIQPYTGFGNATIQSVLPQIMTVWESFFNMDHEGLAIPAWAQSVYPEPLSSVAAQLYAAYTINSPITIKLLQGQLFQEMVGLFGC
uniref:2-phosphoxylose phosphatase 1 n=1 Tax=Graphocephala atropunctata TaxID=36148 RepID=A0A1B6L828_9HEMI